MLSDWTFEDELGITINCGRFIVPSSDMRHIVHRMAKFGLNDGRAGVARNQAFSGEDPREILMHGVPFNIAMEFMNRIGVRFRIQDCWNNYLWAVLEDLQLEPIPAMAWAKTEQLFNLTMIFSRVNPI